MSLCLDDIEIEPALADAGVWMQYLGAKFLVARKGMMYDARLVELYNENIDLIKSNTTEGNEKALEISQRCFAEKILLDWEGVVDKEKNPIPYTPELGLALVRNVKQFELVREIERFSNSHRNFQAHVLEEVAEDVKSSAAS